LWENVSNNWELSEGLALIVPAPNDEPTSQSLRPRKRLRREKTFGKREIEGFDLDRMKRMKKKRQEMKKKKKRNGKDE
jgi:hypothetical protein